MWIIVEFYVVEGSCTLCLQIICRALKRGGDGSFEAGNMTLLGSITEVEKLGAACLLEVMLVKD